MSEPGVYDYAGKASAEDGQVLLDGPDGIAISLTPAAAEGTARSLLQAAAVARRQREPGIDTVSTSAPE
jgi:hypothetical protein